jgi:hypothetical protein
MLATNPMLRLLSDVTLDALSDALVRHSLSGTGNAVL